MHYKNTLKFQLILFTLLSTYNCIAQDIKLDDNIQKVSIEVENNLAYANYDSYYANHIPTVQIAKWKQGYIIAYTNHNRQSYFFFTDSSFTKTSKEFKLNNRIIFQVVTDNNEIALLCGNRYDVFKNNKFYSNHIYFTKVSENGKVLLENKILGTNKLKAPLATVLDDWGNYIMRWTGSLYIVYFPVQHNFKRIGKDIHQGDVTYFIKPDGTICIYNEWGASHSFEQRIAIGERHTVLIAKGDAYPRGMKVSKIPTKNYYIEPLSKGSKSQHNTEIKNRYNIADNTRSMVSTAFKASGRSGANYVPFSLGDAIILNDETIVVSYSSKDRKPTYDVGISITKLVNGKAKSEQNFITNTRSLCEHSVRMYAIDSTKILILWKEFNNRKVNKQLDKYEKSSIDSETIFKEHNLDINKMAIIDNNGQFIVSPQTTKIADWYYTISLKENQTPWHSIIKVSANHCYSPIITTHTGNIAWAHHSHKSKTIDIYIFNY